MNENSNQTSTKCIPSPAGLQYSEKIIGDQLSSTTYTNDTLQTVKLKKEDRNLKQFIPSGRNLLFKQIPQLSVEMAVMFGPHSEQHRILDQFRKLVQSAR